MSEKKKLGCGLTVFGLPVVVLLAHVLLVRLPPYIRHPIPVYFTVTDSNGKPVANAELISHEAGWRYVLPIPFSGQWLTTFPSHSTIADASGNAVISYKQDYLELDAVKVAGQPVPKFRATFHRFDGEDFHHDNKVTEMYGRFSNAPDPYRRDYSIRLDQ